LPRALVERDDAPGEHDPRARHHRPRIGQVAVQKRLDPRHTDDGEHLVTAGEQRHEDRGDGWVGVQAHDERAADLVLVADERREHGVEAQDRPFLDGRTMDPQLAFAARGCPHRPPHLAAIPIPLVERVLGAAAPDGEGDRRHHAEPHDRRPGAGAGAGAIGGVVSIDAQGDQRGRETEREEWQEPSAVDPRAPDGGLALREPLAEQQRAAEEEGEIHAPPSSKTVPSPSSGESRHSRGLGARSAVARAGVCLAPGWQERSGATP
jgi:hypothetical protein